MPKLRLRVHLPLVLCSICILFLQVQAQSPPPGCATQCTGAASQEGCGGPPDIACICSVEFQQAAASCVMQVCSASDTGAALAYFNNLCASAGSFASAASLTSGSGSVFGTVNGLDYTVTISAQAVSIPPTPPPSPSFPGSASASPPAGASPSEASPSSRPSSSNAAATPLRAANLVAGGIGALVAVVV